MPIRAHENVFQMGNSLQPMTLLLIEKGVLTRKSYSDIDIFKIDDFLTYKQAVLPTTKEYCLLPFIVQNIL